MDFLLNDKIRFLGRIAKVWEIKKNNHIEILKQKNNEYIIVCISYEPCGCLRTLCMLTRTLSSNPLFYIYFSTVQQGGVIYVVLLANFKNRYIAADQVYFWKKEEC